MIKKLSKNSHKTSNSYSSVERFRQRKKLTDFLLVTATTAVFMLFARLEVELFSSDKLSFLTWLIVGLTAFIFIYLYGVLSDRFGFSSFQSKRVEAATKKLASKNAELKKLDEAKDEFISMASHQLRTPLTSVKGYIDMVLDGDAGEINKNQRQFLTEAYLSSERMVHLISDFLSMSRLQTGKFIIEKHPTDLKKVLRQEIESLSITAKGYRVSFDVSIDKTVPIMMLDEEKIRQVIMNFTDNAIYYTKPGTSVKVLLKRRQQAVECIIEDQGIGVPKAQQSQLFKKFFRASNAKKQRPDGTGIGIYIAKRIIDGHDGKVIFSSVEGEGSVFGFSLPINKLEVLE